MLTPKEAQALLNKRKKSSVIKPILLEENFPKQNAFIEDNGRFLVAQCSRRAGKTNGLAIRFFKTLEKYPNSQCVYLGLTLDSARDIMWPVLQEINDKYQMGCKFLESRLTMTHPNGAKLRLLGADMSNFIKRLKGRKYPGVAIDEAQDFGPHLQSLVNDVLTPSISDYADGWLALTGTPGPVPQGYFFDITQNRKYGFSYHAWTLIDNPHMPEPAKFIADLKARYEWEDNHPTLMREWKNNWVLDAQSLWIRYNEKTNHYIQLPDIKPAKWNYILGVDWGFRDSDALAVIAWSDVDPNTYLVEELITAKQDISALIENVQSMMKKYAVTKIVMDEGGGGKKMAEEMRRRHQIPVHPADKVRKQETVEFFNDALRLGKFKAKSGSRFAQDSYLIQIDWEKSRPDKIVIKKNPHSDIIDAVLYSFKESPAYTYEPPKSKIQYGSKEWADAQSTGMFERELEGYQQLQDVLFPNVDVEEHDPVKTFSELVSKRYNR